MIFPPFTVFIALKVFLNRSWKNTRCQVASSLYMLMIYLVFCMHLMFCICGHSVLPLVPAVLDTDLPSRDMPTVRHFCSLQCWQRFRLVRSIRQFFWRGHEYAALLCWLLLKKPYRPERWTERRLVNPFTTKRSFLCSAGPVRPLVKICTSPTTKNIVLYLGMYF